MRNPELARKQLLAGFVFSLFALVIGWKVLLPEWQAYHHPQISLTAFNPQAESMALKKIPLASLKYPLWWQKQLTPPLEQSAQQAHVSLEPLTGSFSSFQRVQTLPDPVRQTSFLIKASGSYENLLAFLVALKYEMPSTKINAFHLSQDAKSLPIWHMQAFLDIVVLITS